jgi:hypothetical protein
MIKVVIIGILLLVINSCSNDSKTVPENVKYNIQKDTSSIYLTKIEYKNGFLNYYSNILEQFGLSKNVDIVKLTEYINQPRELVLENLEIDAKEFYIIDSITVFKKSGLISFFTSENIDFIQIQIQDTDRTLMSKLQNRLINHLDKNLRKSKQTNAPAPQGSFEINNFWNTKNYSIELSYYNDNDKLFILITIK